MEGHSAERALWAAIDGADLFYVGATARPAHRWEGWWQERRGVVEWVDGHQQDERWERMVVLALYPPGVGGNEERALIRLVWKVDPRCTNRHPGGGGVSKGEFMFLYVVRQP
jgi:hypothetical protein